MPEGRKSLAQQIAEIKPTIEIETNVDTYGHVDGESDNDYRKLRHARHKKAVDVLDKEIKGFDAEEMAARVLKSLKADLAVKRAELMKSEAEMDAAGISYSGTGASDKDTKEKDAKPKPGEDDK